MRSRCGAWLRMRGCIHLERWHWLPNSANWPETFAGWYNTASHYESEYTRECAIMHLSRSFVLISNDHTNNCCSLWYVDRQHVRPGQSQMPRRKCKRIHTEFAVYAPQHNNESLWIDNHPSHDADCFARGALSRVLLSIHFAMAVCHCTRINEILRCLPWKRATNKVLPHGRNLEYRISIWCPWKHLSPCYLPMHLLSCASGIRKSDWLENQVPSGLVEVEILNPGGEHAESAGLVSQH